MSEREEPRSDALALCAAGALPPPIAAMRILIHADSPEAVQAQLSQAMTSTTEVGRSRLTEVAELLSAHPQAWRTVRSIVTAVQHDPHTAPWADSFDTAVRLSPEASVALYCLGDSQLLSAATAEVVGLLALWGVLGRQRNALDIGCGIGRLEQALTSVLGTITGIDVSPGMIEEAQRRCAGLPNVRFERGSGCDLGRIASDSIDVVMMVDTFPYLLLSGESSAAACMREIARVLRSGGDAVILNVSYRGDYDADAADMHRFAAQVGLQVLASAQHPCKSWDAAAFQLVKP